MFFFRKNKKKSAPARNPRIYSGLPRKISEKKKSRFSRFLFWILFLCFLGVAFYLLLLSPFLEVEIISVEGNEKITSEEIVARAGEAIEGKYFQYFSKRNFFLLSRKKVNEKLRSDFNRLEISSIEKKFPNAILIRVKERQPEIAWCSGGVCYLVDKEGLVYAGADARDEEITRERFLIVIDDNARPIDIKKTMIGIEFIDYLKQIDVVLIDKLGLKLKDSYHTPSLSSREILVKIDEKEGWELKMDVAVSPEETEKILETLFEKELEPEKRKNLEYLDLRVKNKVYYKMR